MKETEILRRLKHIEHDVLSGVIVQYSNTSFGVTELLSKEDKEAITNTIDLLENYHTLIENIALFYNQLYINYKFAKKKVSSDLSNNEYYPESSGLFHGLEISLGAFFHYFDEEQLFKIFKVVRKIERGVTCITH